MRNDEKDQRVRSKFARFIAYLLIRISGHVEIRLIAFGKRAGTQADLSSFVSIVVIVSSARCCDINQPVTIRNASFAKIFVSRTDTPNERDQTRNDSFQPRRPKLVDTFNVIFRFNVVFRPKFLFANKYGK